MYVQSFIFKEKKVESLQQMFMFADEKTRNDLLFHCDIQFTKPQDPPIDEMWRRLREIVQQQTKVQTYTRAAVLSILQRSKNRKMNTRIARDIVLTREKDKNNLISFDKHHDVKLEGPWDYEWEIK